MKALELLLLYLNKRPITAKIIDVLTILVLCTGIGTAYVLATNFHTLFLTEKEIEYGKFLAAAENIRQINDILTKLRDETESSRVGVFQFHNGTVGIGDIPFFFYSQTFEVVNSGVSSELANNQRISLSVDPHVILLKVQEFDYDNMIDDSSALDHMFRTRGVKQYYRHAVYSLHGEFVGFITIEYNDVRVIDKDEIQEIMSRYSGAITGLLK